MQAIQPNNRCGSFVAGCVAARLAAVTRIIAGAARGRRLATLDGDTTRPTSDRVREALFSSIASWAGSGSAAELDGLSFVDLFAGSGAIGLEAASRGASPVVLVEKNRAAAQVIRRNLSSVAPKARLIEGAVEAVVASPAPQAFDVVWADPPYALDGALLSVIISDVRRHGWLMSDGLVVVERSARAAELTVPDATATWSSRYGETQLLFFRFDEQED